MTEHRSHRSRTPRLYDVCDWVSEGVLYFMVLFGPWVFGTTRHWSIWTMNIAAYVIGVLLITKWVVRWRTGYQPVRWGEGTEDGGWRMEDGREGSAGAEPTLEVRGQTPEVGRAASAWPASATTSQPPAPDPRPLSSAPRWLTIILATLTIIILGYCLINALNARATYHADRRLFEYHECIGWLPHSYDSSSTWFVFWQYLGLAFVFWGARDWLLGKTRSERRRASNEPSSPFDPPSSILHPPSIPSRLRRLLWVVCINGAVLATECILQRLDGTNKLLWLVEPVWNKDSISQFGPFAYRGNAAEYLNLIWPVCLGFWWALRRAAKRSPRKTARAGSNPHVVLLPCAVVVAAGPIISTARGGALIATAGVLIATILLLLRTRRGGWLGWVGILSLFFTIVGFAAYLGWAQLEERLRTLFADEMSGRVEIYQNAHNMATDFPWLGSGPGTFGPLYQEYRTGLDQTWEAWVHDDWLETRITFGRIGFTLVLLMLLIVVARWFATGGIHFSRTAVWMLWLGLAGTLLQARFDFPLQVYSILFVFVLWCALLFCVSRE